MAKRLNVLAQQLAPVLGRTLLQAPVANGRGIATKRSVAASRRTARLVGYGMTPLGKLNRSVTSLMQEALQKALDSAGLTVDHLDGLVAVPSLADPRFMEAHHLATRVGLLPRPGVRVSTIDTGGAGPVSALLQAARWVQRERCSCVAIVAGDAVSSMDTAEFLHRADAGVQDQFSKEPASPCIPNGYGRVAEWQMKTYGATREQLAMVSVLMSRQASRHPAALTRRPHTLEQVLAARQIAPATSLLECARRSDGAAAVIVASSQFVDCLGCRSSSASGETAEPALSPLAASGGVVLLGGGEASGPLFPPATITESMFSCEYAAKLAYSEAQLLPSDIDWFGLYDCYPVCFFRAVEAVGLAPKGKGGEWVEAMHRKTASMDYAPADFPVNTHGGLLAFGAPWEVPAMYNIIEAAEQLAGTAGERQVPGARRALVYGNGGIFSHSSVAILAKPVD